MKQLDIKENRGLAAWVRRRPGVQAAGLLLPGLIAFGLFFVIPLLIVVGVSFTAKKAGTVDWTHWTLNNYVSLVTNFAGDFDPLYLNIFLRSLWFALLTTVICLLVGYPLAYFIARRGEKWRAALILLIMIPFWTNFLVRTYALQLIFRKEGLLNSLLLDGHIIKQPLDMMFTPGLVLFGLVYGYLPFMVLPLYASIEKFDFSLLEAAQDLGAGTFRTLRKVLLPLTMPGVVAGSILVFIPVVGSYVTSDLLGAQSSGTLMVGNTIENQFLKSQNWPLGSAMSLVLMAVVLLAIIIYFRVARGDKKGAAL